MWIFSSSSRSGATASGCSASSPSRRRSSRWRSSSRSISAWICCSSISRWYATARLGTAAWRDRPAARRKAHVAEADVVVLVLLGDLAERVGAVDEAEAALQPRDVDPVLGIRRRVEVRPARGDAQAIGRKPAHLRAAAVVAVVARVRAHAVEVAEAVVELRPGADHLVALALGVERPQLEARRVRVLPVGPAAAVDELEVQLAGVGSHDRLQAAPVDHLAGLHLARTAAPALDLERSGAHVD